MKRADKIRLAEEANRQAKEADNRDAGERDAARREWGQVRKAARDAFMSGGEWRELLTEFRDRDGFYTPTEREQMIKAYTDELLMYGLR